MSRRHQPRTDHAHAVDEQPTPCPGPCNGAARRADHALQAELAAAEAEHRRPDPTIVTDARDAAAKARPGKPVWCVDVPAFNHEGVMLDTLEHRGCTGTILDRLHRLPDLAAHLAPGKLNTPRDSDVDPGSSHGGGARALSHAPSPSPAWDTVDELVRWLVDLEDWLRDVRGDEPAVVEVVGWRRERRTLSAAVRYLHAHGATLLATGDAEAVGKGVLATYRRLEHQSGRDRLTHRLAEPCPACGRKGLRRKDGAELVSCSQCRATWDWEHFEHLCRVYADSVRAGKGATA